MTPHEEDYPSGPDDGNGWRTTSILLGIAAAALVGILVITGRNGLAAIFAVAAPITARAIVEGAQEHVCGPDRDAATLRPKTRQVLGAEVRSAGIYFRSSINHFGGASANLPGVSPDTGDRR